MSTVFKETWALEIFPNVEPPAMSERLVKVCTGTCTFLHNALKTAADTASVVYFWFALYLITIPSFNKPDGWLGLLHLRGLDVLHERCLQRS